MTSEPQTIGVIGVGVMGRALLERFRSAPSGFAVRAFDRHPERVAALTAGQVAASLEELVDTAAVVVLAIKPQQFAELAETVGERASTSLIISIMAGISTTQITHALHARRVVRAMPNLAAQVGESVTGWFATDAVSAADRTTVRALLSSIGHELELTNEASIDGLTAVSGSGPAYFFAVAAALVGAAQAQGFSPAVADELVRQTLVGAASVAASGDQPFSELAQAVASKGGTTEAALTVLRDREISQTFIDAVAAAHHRASELSQGAP